MNGRHIDTNPAVREVAFAILLHPNPSGTQHIQETLRWDEPRVRNAAALLEDDGLLTHELSPMARRGLFTALANAWCCDQPEAALASAPPAVTSTAQSALLTLGLEDPEHEPGWALAGSHAAQAWRIPVTTVDPIPHFYVPSENRLREAEDQIGRATGAVGAYARVAPMYWITNNRFDGARRQLLNSDWPIVHTLVSAVEVAVTEPSALRAWRDVPDSLRHAPWMQP